MFLHQLLREFDPKILTSGIPDVQIGGICDDSRLARAGDLFIARPGTKTEGSKFISQACQRGAVAVVTAAPLADCPLPQVCAANVARAGAELAHIFHARPSQALRVVAVTGTNGKTTTAYLVRHLLNRCGQRCGLIGTVEIDDGTRVREATLTTPGAVQIAGLLAAMRDSGCRACAMEASSHALHQDRVLGVKFAAAAFTNLSGDHLDYHGTMDDYAAAKARLFEMLEESAVGVINADDARSARMIRDCRARIVRFGFGPEADYRAAGVKLGAEASRFVLQNRGGEAWVELGLIGRHNIANALTAAALVGEAFGLSVQQIAAGLKDARGAPGRLQAVRAGQGFAVLVDYAHTDDALENVLSALRAVTRGRLRLLFGCGGDRDRTKRPRMARAAAKLADAVYVTSDNPRTENPAAIVDEIVAGFPRDGIKPVYIEVDRRKAIEKILGDAQSGDVVLLAGKGHENYQIIGTTKHHFDDVEEAIKVLQKYRQGS
ncbi:MAG: UDP-N-acetylmuramoyl-L-alanyl-D-glutamate--2,6-diaminopimelate ligase [Tepidisphaeraceae bacterium]|jgi:UDP-N-acetylmuramoyl-L-alanyl-D-glutamate--2,6-diaminopimelate ligase